MSGGMDRDPLDSYFENEKQTVKVAMNIYDEDEKDILVQSLNLSIKEEQRALEQHKKQLNQLNNEYSSVIKVIETTKVCIKDCENSITTLKNMLTRIK